MRRTWPVLFIVLVAAAPATQPASPILARAHRILDSIKETSYQHTTDIDESTGEYHCDCSGLVDYLLRKDLPEHYKVIKYSNKMKRPRAVELHDHFAAAPEKPVAGELWQRVLLMKDVQPGDIIAWKKDPQPETGSTGHVVLADSVATQIAPDLYSIVIIDSTTGPHFEDTRQKGQGGVGRGTIFIRTNEQGRPIARSGKSEKGPFTKFPISVGRPVLKRDQ